MEPRVGRGTIVRVWAVRTGAIAQTRAGLLRGRTTARFRTAGLERERTNGAPTSPVTATEPTGFREPVHEANGLFLLKARA
jgi:hypothetical protein